MDDLEAVGGPMLVVAVTPVKQGTAARLGLHPPTGKRRRHAKRKNAARIDFNSVSILVNQRPPDPVVRLVPVPYERGMLT